MNNIAIITARGGSKRIPRKNIRSFCGKPAISYVITAALHSGLFKEVMVSTDDKEIADIAIKYGAVIPFMRSTENANDYATTADVLYEVLTNYANQQISFEHGCCIYPTAVFTTSEKLKKGYDLMISRGFNSVVPVVKYSNSIFRSLKLQDGRIGMIYPEYENTRSQDILPAYYDSGQFYWFAVNAFVKSKKLYTENTGGLEIDEMECQDIDNEADWKLAEIKYQLQNASA
jgi:pseudaminic acid cytidylyltransferase